VTGQQVSTADVARSAIDRLQAELEAANAKLARVAEVAERCEASRVGIAEPSVAIAYGVVGGKLWEILAPE
jgi:hypothetical protein